MGLEVEVTDPGAVVKAMEEFDNIGRNVGFDHRPRRVASEASSVRLVTPSLVKVCARCVFTVARPMNSRCPISGLVSPSAASRTTSSSVGVRLAQPEEGRFRSPRARDE